MPTYFYEPTARDRFDTRLGNTIKIAPNSAEIYLRSEAALLLDKNTFHRNRPVIESKHVNVRLTMYRNLAKAQTIYQFDYPEEKYRQNTKIPDEIWAYFTSRVPVPGGWGPFNLKIPFCSWLFTHIHSPSMADEELDNLHSISDMPDTPMMSEDERDDGEKQDAGVDEDEHND